MPPSASQAESSPAGETPAKDPKSVTEHTANGTAEHIDGQEMAEAKGIRVAIDPVAVDIERLLKDAQSKFQGRQFAELDQLAAELRKTKALFDNGRWKLVSFYEALSSPGSPQEAAWQAYNTIYKEWIDAMPQSITARVGYVEFLSSYAWLARGSAYADEVPAEDMQLFQERLQTATQVLREARSLPEKDPYYWAAGLTVALGSGWAPMAYEEFWKEGVAYEPRFHEYYFRRAQWLLPRWYGRPGDWEAFAKKAAADAGEWGNELYTRIVVFMMRYHSDIFRDARPDRHRTLEGVAELRKRYPKSLTMVHQMAFLACMGGGDRKLAQEVFAQIGDEYLPTVWKKPERFVHVRNWARTGEW